MFKDAKNEEIDHEMKGASLQKMSISPLQQEIGEMANMANSISFTSDGIEEMIRKIEGPDIKFDPAITMPEEPRGLIPMTRTTKEYLAHQIERQNVLLEKLNALI